MKKKDTFNAGNFIISNFVPQLCIMYGFNKICKILNLYNQITINKEEYIIADIKMLDKSYIETNVLIPLHINACNVDDNITFLGKNISLKELTNSEKILFQKLLKFSLENYKEEYQLTIDDEISKLTQEMLINLSNKSIKFLVPKDDSVADVKYLPLLTLEDEQNIHKIIFEIPLFKYLETMLPTIEIINKEFIVLINFLKEDTKNKFKKAREAEFII